VKLHPFKAAFFMGANIGGAICFELRYPDQPVWLGWVMVTSSLWGIIFLNDARRIKVISVLLSLAIATIPVSAPAEEDIQPAAGGPIALGVGLGVLVGTGYVAIRIIRVCAKRKRYTPPTNDTERADMFLPAADADKYAGLAQFENPDYCIEPAAESPELSDNAFVINAMVTLDENWKPSAQTLNVSHYKGSQLVDFDAFNAGLQEWGVTWNGRANDRQYAKNGQPAIESEVPFILTDIGPVFYPDREVFHVVVETATRLGEDANWGILFQTWIPAGVRMIINDTPQGEQSFYRLSVVP